MRISSSRLVSVRFVMRVHWIMRDFCGGMIMVPMAVAAISWGVWVCVGGLVSFWFIIRVFQFWFSLIWFVVGLCCIMSAWVKNSIIFWAFSWGISRVSATSFMLCHTLSFSRANSFSSFVDKGLASEGCLVVNGFVVYKWLRFFRLDYWSGFRF